MSKVYLIFWNTFTMITFKFYEDYKFTVATQRHTHKCLYSITSLETISLETIYLETTTPI